jgi:hypothetical protein
MAGTNNPTATLPHKHTSTHTHYTHETGLPVKWPGTICTVHPPAHPAAPASCVPHPPTHPSHPSDHQALQRCPPGDDKPAPCLLPDGQMARIPLELPQPETICSTWSLVPPFSALLLQGQSGWALTAFHHYRCCCCCGCGCSCCCCKPHTHHTPGHAHAGWSHSLWATSSGGKSRPAVCGGRLCVLQQPAATWVCWPRLPAGPGSCQFASCHPTIPKVAVTCGTQLC